MKNKTIGSFEAKTHFAELVDEASRGAVITITRRGRPVAQLGPCAKKDFSDYKAAVERAREIRNSLKGAVNVRELIKAGRKY